MVEVAADDMNQRCQTKNQARYERQRHREQHHRGINGDLPRARQGGQAGRLEEFQTPKATSSPTATPMDAKRRPSTTN